MPEKNELFDAAVNRFVRDIGYGDAIMHLADRGYTLSRIRTKTRTKLPDEYICKKIMDSYMKYDKMLLTEPGSARREKITMVRDSSIFGRPSFRQVTEIVEEPVINLRNRKWSKEELPGMLKTLEKKRYQQNARTYASFLVTPGKLSRWELMLSDGHIDYLRAFLYMKREVFLVVDDRVMAILEDLLNRDAYDGTIYVLSEGEKWTF